MAEDSEAEDGKTVFGVVQLINKTEFDGQVGIFAEDDTDVIETFASFTGSKLLNSGLFKRHSVVSEAGAAFGESNKPKRASGHPGQHEITIAEGDEEEEDDA